MVTGFEEAMAIYNDHGDLLVVQHRRGRSPSGRCPSKATTSATSSRSTATGCRSATSCRRSIRRATPITAGCSMRLITPKRLKENEEFMWRLADRQIDEFLDPRRVRVRPRLREPVHPARHRRPARRARSGSRGLPRGAARRRTADDHAATRRAWRTSRWSSSTSGSRAYIEDRRREPARRRHDAAGHRDVPRRLAARRSTT